MAYQRYRAEFARLSPADLAWWRELATSSASDCLNRAQSMAGAIKPLALGTRLAGPARTVAAMVGDNGMVHHAIAAALPGDILVIDAGGVADIAVFGEVMARAALAKGVAGVVVDGAVRDSAALRGLGLAVFCRSAVPRGPQKGWGGTLDGPVAVGGVAVRPGDLVLGDDDGVVVVPAAQLARVKAAALALAEREAVTVAAIESGKTTVELNRMPEPEWLD